MNVDKIKDVSVIIMDGSDKRKVSYITAILGEWSDPTVRNMMVCTLSEDHPTTVVIKTKMSDYYLSVAQNEIEYLYPGLCVFNPPMTV